MRRICFQLQVKPDRIDEYRDRHAAVWPDMLTALADTGWHNYSLFLRDDGLLIGYFETPSLEQALAGMASTEVNARWQRERSISSSISTVRPPTPASCSSRRSSTSRTSSLHSHPQTAETQNREVM
jgi:L-rhamnose mutarotase